MGSLLVCFQFLEILPPKLLDPVVWISAFSLAPRIIKLHEYGKLSKPSYLWTALHDL